MADTFVVVVHGIAVTEPVRARTKAVSKALAAELALKVLEDESSDHHITRLCDCNAKGSEAKPRVDVVEDEEEGEEGEEGDAEEDGEGRAENPFQGDETEDGFAVLAQRLVGAREGRSSGIEADHEDSSDMDISEDEVEV